MSTALPPTIQSSANSSDETQVHNAAEKPTAAKASMTPLEKKTILTQLVGQLPPWVMKIKDPRQQKLLFRCWFASWLMIVILLPIKSLHTLGQAAFFGGIASLMMPANMPIQSFILSMALLILCSCFGWAWGCAAIRAAYVARDPDLYARTVQQLGQKYGSDITKKDLTLSIYHGVFLDSRSTAVFGVFLGVGAFFLGLLRAKKPKLALPVVFATIFLDVLCSYGPLFPTPQYSLLNSFVISTACYVATGIIVIIIIFPQTLNHEWLGSAVKLLDATKEFIALQEEVLNVELDVCETDPMSDCLLTRMRTKADGLSTQFVALSSKTGMLEAEFSYGQLNAEDLTSFELPIRNVVTRTRGLMSFLTLLVSHVNTRRRDARTGTDTPISKSLPRHNTNLRVRDTFRLIHVRRIAAKHEIIQKVRIEDFMPILRSATKDLRVACVEAAKAASNALWFINTQRYKRKLPWMAKKLRKIEEEEVLDVAAALKNLRAAIDAYKTKHRFEILHPFAPLIDSHNASPLVDEHGHPPFSLRTLFLGFVFQSNLLWTADSLKSLLALILEAQKKRPEGQLWWPTQLSRFFHLLLRDAGTSPLETGQSPEDGLQSAESGEEYFAHGYQRDPDSRPPNNLGQRIGQALHRARRWLGTPEAIFAFKHTAVSILLWLPAVFKKSAWFTYTQRGLWALIMGQITLVVYVSDQIKAVKGRILGTVLGGLIGMVAWYVGNGGSGEGNAYGLAASSALFIVPVTFNRLFNPVPLDAIMSGVTTMLVIGYSWVNAHLDPPGNPGVGWNVAWRRVVCVSIGSAAAMILMLLPPQSMRRDVRLSNAATLEDISGLYAGLLSKWLGEIDKSAMEANADQDANTEAGTVMSEDEIAAKEAKDNNHSLASYEQWAPVFRSRLIKVSARLNALQVQTEGAKWEGSIRGEWPFEKYANLVAVQSKMVGNLVQLSSSLGALSPSWRRTLLYKTPVLNPNLVTDTMAVFAIFTMSLRTGKAISEVLPRSLVDRVYYHQEMTARFQGDNGDDDDNDDDNDDENDGETTAKPSVAFKSTSSHHYRVLTKEMFMSEEWAFYATGLAGAFQILFALDETRQICADLCGEVPLRGFEDWRRDFELRQLGERV
ncbi:hypothetical protein FRB94_006979 [Tulasnella sp. JGI-2019a]|nr:hypothetical protein FRB93_002154 [Tulasnella sp. JGI-2019a]KAG8998239.1 hypothetical protein FRB94_006979 [Tulasnella sp. JGI-2019a]KAG9032646.1 hypothetical protein FRB95_001156 [Tulasnella sp. JGI-2019a]